MAITAQARGRPSPPATGRSHPHPVDPPSWTVDLADIGRHAAARPHASPRPPRSLCRPSRRAPRSSPAPTPPPAVGNHQIPIDPQRRVRPPRVPCLEAFGRRPGAARYVSTGRHPKPFTPPAYRGLPLVGPLYGLQRSKRGRFSLSPAPIGIRPYWIGVSNGPLSSARLVLFSYTHA